MKSTYKEFNLKMGKHIKDLRIKLHYTRESLAELSGISSKFLYELETGKKGCSTYVFYKIIQAMKISPSYFFDSTVLRSDNDMSRIFMLFNDRERKYVNSIMQTLYDMLKEINKNV